MDNSNTCKSGMIKGLLTYEDVGKLLGISAKAVDSRRKRGQIPYVKVSKENYRFDPSAIASLFNLEDVIPAIDNPAALMTVKEAASFLAVTEQTVRGLLKHNKLKKTKISSHTIRIKGSHILDFIKANSVVVYGTANKKGA